MVIFPLSIKFNNLFTNAIKAGKLFAHAIENLKKCSLGDKETVTTLNLLFAFETLFTSVAKIELLLLLICSDYLYRY